MKTRTGSYPIGIRRTRSAWQTDLTAFAPWARDNGFEAIDLADATREDLGVLAAHGLRLGSVDLLDFGALMHQDAGKRKDVIAQNVEHVKHVAALGAKAFFCCLIPGDPTRKRPENYKLAVECIAPIAQMCAASGACLAVEGWPGPAPSYPCLCCTPETCRAMLKDVGAGMGLNYDPSHLIRLGVDHVRFLEEFMGAIKHVHAKDTELCNEDVYELGLYQDSAFVPRHAYGEWAWRYTIPGSGCARWTEIFARLRRNGYDSVVSIELEDENFHGSEELERAGLLHSRAFLAGA